MPDPRRSPLTRSVAGLIVLLGLHLTPPPGAVAQRGPSTPEPAGVWPLSPTPEVVHRFDPPDTPYGAGHRGVDLLGHPGQLVRAALPGQVTYAGPLAGKGVVVVAHGDTRTTYEPVSASAAVGDEVAAGGVLGSLDAVPSHCLPRSCLHWGGIRNVDDVYLDPLRLVGAGPVRLLPFLSGPSARGPGRPGSGRSVAPVRNSVDPYSALLLRLLRPWWPA